MAESVSAEGERLRRGRNALELVVREYAWSKIAVSFEALYRRLLGAKRPPS